MMHPDDARDRGLGAPRGVLFTLPLVLPFWVALLVALLLAA